MSKFIPIVSVTLATLFAAGCSQHHEPPASTRTDWSAYRTGRLTVWGAFASYRSPDLPNGIPWDENERISTNETQFGKVLNGTNCHSYLFGPRTFNSADVELRLPNEDLERTATGASIFIFSGWVYVPGRYPEIETDYIDVAFDESLGDNQAKGNSVVVEILYSGEHRIYVLAGDGQTHTARFTVDCVKYEISEAEDAYKDVTKLADGSFEVSETPTFASNWSWRTQQRIRKIRNAIALHNPCE